MNILANDGIAASGKEELEKAGFTVVTETVPQEDLIEAINKEIDSKIVQSLPLTPERKKNN